MFQPRRLLPALLLLHGTRATAQVQAWADLDVTRVESDVVDDSWGITFAPGAAVAAHRHSGGTVTTQVSGSHNFAVLEGNARLIQAGAATPAAGAEAGEPMTVGQEYTLEPGDVIFTGTPGGVGAAMKPPKFLKAGDVMRIEIDKIGAIEATVVPEAV